MLTILSQGSLAALAAFRLNGGDLLVILSMAMWSIYTICLRWRPAGLHMLSFLFALMVVGDLCVLPFFVGEIALGRHMKVTPANIAALASVGAVLVGAGVHLLEPRRRAGRRECRGPVRPSDARLRRTCSPGCSWANALAPFHVAGIALILTGIWITSRLGRRPVPAPAGTD